MFLVIESNIFQGRTLEEQKFFIFFFENER